MTAAKRRDFTINALMYDVKEGTIVDFFGGEEDLANGLIKHIDDETFVGSSNLRYMFEEPATAGSSEANPNEANVSPSTGIEV